MLCVPASAGGTEWHVLYTRRTDQVADHKGQVSFPGGRSEDGDNSLEATALREAQEEIGLQPSDVRLVGRLERLYTITNYLITPVVGLIPWPYSFHLEQIEVGRVFTIPLRWLADESHYAIHEREVPTPKLIRKMHRVIIFEPYDGETLWGVSAEITLRLLWKLGLSKLSGAE